MSTSVVHPGAAKAPSGKTIGMLVGGLALAIVLGFVFYLNQSQDVTVSGAGTQTAEVVTDAWLVQRQAEINAARDQAAAYETARIQAQDAAQAASQPVFPGTSAEIIERALAEQAQARLESQSEAFGLSEVIGADKATQAWTDRLTGLAAASATPMIAPPLDELSLYTTAPAPMIAPRLDELTYWPTVGGPVEFVPGSDFSLTELTHMMIDLAVDGSHVNPAFGHEFGN